jgi:hypothetical protein
MELNGDIMGISWGYFSQDIEHQEYSIGNVASGVIKHG